MTTVILVTIGILVVILGYTTFNLLRKNEKLEDIAISQQNLIEAISVQIQQSEEKLNKIDEKGVFKGDDEIGWFFNEIKKIQNDLSQFRIN
jgi:HAMP domain-containing protein